ncbi:MAG: DUF2341 domain-containing protein, partial [Candidatus Omnitrophica bacterium]|nr:DUF2341 domain-containing protein [Candidatus Omnitrophota bacterium]
MKLFNKKTKNALIFAVVMMLLSFLAVCGQAEMRVYKSSLIWRLDGYGDFSLPGSLTGTYVIPKSVPVDGLIKSMTANWQSKGEVKLELSADGGKHYYKVINGVPLTEGFEKGDRLQWRAYFAENSSLSEVKIVYTDTSGITTSFGNPKLSGFKYKKKLHVTGAEKMLYNYQVDIEVGEAKETENCDVTCNGNMLDDFKDVYFTSTDGETLLSIYREKIEGTSPERIAKVWVKIGQIPVTGIDIYMYYGKSDAQDI